MKLIASLYNTAVNNKRNIGIAILILNQGLKAFFPNFMTPEKSDWIDSTGLFIGSTGIAHHGYNKFNIAKANKNKQNDS